MLYPDARKIRNQRMGSRYELNSAKVYIYGMAWHGSNKDEIMYNNSRQDEQNMRNFATDRDASMYLSYLDFRTLSRLDKIFNELDEQIR